MQLSYNVIKNNSVKSKGLKEIVTNIDIQQVLKPEVEENIKNNIESYENLARTIIENARRQGDQIVASAYDDAARIEQNLLAEAEIIKQQAYQEGYNEGYTRAYNETLVAGKQQSDVIVSAAHDMLNNAKLEYEKYMQEKYKELNDLILTISKSVLKTHIEDNGLIGNMIFDALEASKKSKNFIIRCNSIHMEYLKAQVNSWKEQLGFFGDIFVLKDDALEIGNAVIDKGNGKIVVGIDYALLRIKDILEGKE
jgi:flagellar assembly protein FliH